MNYDWSLPLFTIVYTQQKNKNTCLSVMTLANGFDAKFHLHHIKIYIHTQNYSIIMLELHGKPMSTTDLVCFCNGSCFF